LIFSVVVTHDSHIPAEASIDALPNDTPPFSAPVQRQATKALAVA
jgi:hypothetical protein